MRYIIFISSAIIVLLLAIFYFGGNRGSTIIALKTYFRNYGFVVINHTNTPEEEKMISETRKFLKTLTDKDPYPIRESEDIYVDGIYLNITTYKNKDVAKDFYEKSITTERNRKQSNISNNTKYYQSDYYLNDIFVMRIDHYLVSSSNFLSPQVLDSDKEKLTKIITAFNKF